MDDARSPEARRKVADMTRIIGYVLASAGLFVWFVIASPMIGIAMVLAGIGDILIAAFLLRRIERDERSGGAR
jgi:hypothetical protein